MPQAEGGGGGSKGVVREPGVPIHEPTKRKRRPLFDPVAEATGDFSQKLAAAQSASQNTLTSDFTYGLALAGDHDRDVARASALIARNSDLVFPRTHRLVVPDPDDPDGEPVVLKPKEMVDPLTGEPLSLQRARALISDINNGMLIAGSLAQFSEKGLPSRLLGGRRDVDTGHIMYAHKKVDPSAVAAFVQTFNVLPGKVGLATAINAAASLAAEEVPLGRFQQALGTLVEWNGNTRTLTEAQVIGMAQYWAQNHERAMRVEDVGPLYDPVLRGARELAKATQNLTPSIYTSLDEATQAAAAGQIRDAVTLASQNAENYQKYSDEIRRSVTDVLSDQPSFMEQALSTATEFYYGDVLERIGGGLWWAASGLEEAFPGLLGGGVSAEEMRAQGWDLVRLGGDPESHRTVGDYFARATGADPNDRGYGITANVFEFALFWYADPFIIAGKFARGWQMGRLALTGTERELTSAGLISNLGFRARTRGRDIGTQVEDWLAGTASTRHVKALGLKGEMTNAEFLARGSVRNPEATARIYRGAFGSPGMDPRVTAFIEKWIKQRFSGKVVPEAVEDTADIWRVAMGARPASQAGYRFREALEATGLRAVESRLNGVIRKNIGRTLDETGGEINALTRKKIEVAISRELTQVGFGKQIINPILKNLRASTDDELLILSVAKKKDLRRALGIEQALKQPGEVTQTQFLQASDLMRAHVRNIDERRAAIRGWIGDMGGRSTKGLARKLRQLVSKQEWDDLVKPMYDEFLQTPERSLSDFAEQVTETLVQHQRGGGIISDLIGEAGLREAKGNVVALMEEVRGVLGDDLAEVVMAGVQTQGQMRTRLRQLVAGPGVAAADDLTTGALQLGVATWQDQLGLLEGVGRVFPTDGFLQAAREARLGIGTSKFWKARQMEWFRSVYEKNPPAILNIESFNAAEQWTRWLERMHVPRAQVDEAVAEMRRLMMSRSGLRERQIAKYFQHWTKQGYKAMGLPESAAEQVMNAVRPHHNYVSRWVNMREKIAKGVGLDPMGEPPLETMLKNIWMLPSPREMEVGMRRAFGRFHGVDRKARSMFGKAVDELSTEEWDELVGAVKNSRILAARGLERGAIMLDHARNTWVAWQLLRPGWPLKVLPDENLRALVTLHDFFDRVAAVSAYAKIFTKLGIKGRQVPVTLLNGKQTVFELRLPGLLPHEAMASQGLMHGTMLKSLGWRQRELAKKLETALEVVRPGSKQYWDIWAHMLERRIGGSDLATWILKSFVGHADDGRPWTWGRVVENARANPRVWQAMRTQPGDTLDDVLNRARTYVSQAVSVGGRIDDRLVEASLAGGMTPNTLKKMYGRENTSRLPVLPDLELSEAVGVTSGFLGNFRDTLTDFLMRRPSDWLNRNPLYKGLYDRELERLIKVETQAGRRFGSEELVQLRAGEHELARTARAYALDRELSTMFTYINNSRFAEAARHIFPFVSPYQEQFTVWGRLLWENPHIAEETRLMLDLARDTGVIYKEEATGEWVIKNEVLIPALAVSLLFNPLAFVYAGAGIGAAEAAEEVFNLPETSWVTPVNNLNLFLSNTLTIGGIPLPVPGLSPPAEFFLNKVAEETGDFPFKANLVNYFSAYGTDFSVLPTSWHRVLTAAFPKFDPEMFENTKNAMSDWLILSGYEVVDEKGREIPGAAATLEERADTLAREWLLLRGVQQFVSPTSPMPLTETSDVRDEFFDLIDQHGYTRASKLMQERYPDSPNITMLGIGYSLWERFGPSIPPTTEATAILNDPNFAKAALEYPEMAFFLIPNEFREGTYDFDAASAQLNEALRKTNPLTYTSSTRPLHGREYGEGPTGGRLFEYLRQEGWERFGTIESAFKHKLQAAGSPPEGTEAYEAIKEKWYDRPIDRLQRSNYAWANDYALHDEPFLDDALAKLRTVSELPIWRDTEFGKAIRDYFNGADPIRQAMYANNITGLDTASARDLGLDEQFEQLTTTMEERWPTVWPYLDRYWLGRDLTNVETHRDDVLARVGADPKWVAENLTPWSKEWEEAGRRIEAANTQTQESRAFLRLNELSRRAEAIERKSGLNPQQLWWDTLTRHEQDETKLRVAQKPYVFLTTFERRHVLGLDTSPDVEQAFQLIAEAKVAVNQQIDQGADAGNTWESFDNWVKKEILPVHGMPKAIRQAKQFGYTLFKTLPKEWMQGTEGDAWRAIRDGALAIQAAFKEAEFVDDDEFRAVRVDFGRYIQEWKQYSPDFREHVDYLREISGDQLNEVLLSELWWTLI